MAMTTWLWHHDSTSAELDRDRSRLEEVPPDIVGLTVLCAALIALLCVAVFSLGGATGAMAAMIVAGLSAPLIILGMSWYAARARRRR